MRRFAMFVAALGVWCAFSSTPVGAAANVPFNGWASGQDTSESFGVDGIHLTSLIHGVGSQIGLFTETLDYTLSYDLVDFAGTATITAADGSELFLVDSGTEPGFAAQVFPTPFTATFTVAGGTGRFASTTGQGSVNGIDHGAGSFTFTFAGQLSR